MLNLIKDVCKHRDALTAVHSQRNHLRWLLDLGMVDKYNEELKSFQKLVKDLKPVGFR